MMLYQSSNFVKGFIIQKKNTWDLCLFFRCFTYLPVSGDEFPVYCKHIFFPLFFPIYSKLLNRFVVMSIGYILGVAFSLARPPVIFSRGSTDIVPFTQNHSVYINKSVVHIYSEIFTNHRKYSITLYFKFRHLKHMELWIFSFRFRNIVVERCSWLFWETIIFELNIF